MVFFEKEIVDRITSNPFTITVSDFTSNLETYMKLHFKALLIASLASLTIPATALYIDSSISYFTKLDNTPTTKTIVLPLVTANSTTRWYEFEDFFDHYELFYNAPLTSITFTIKSLDDDSIISLNDYEISYLRMGIKGL